MELYVGIAAVAVAVLAVAYLLHRKKDSAAVSSGGAVSRPEPTPEPEVTPEEPKR